MSKGAKPRDKRTTGKLETRKARARIEYRCHYCGIGLGYHPHIKPITYVIGAVPDGPEYSATLVRYACRNTQACDRRMTADLPPLQALSILGQRYQGDE